MQSHKEKMKRQITVQTLRGIRNVKRERRWAEQQSKSERDLGACTLTEEEKKGYCEIQSLKLVSYITRICWVFGLCPTCSVQKKKKGI
jgi:hypothetical protein